MAIIRTALLAALTLGVGLGLGGAAEHLRARPGPPSHVQSRTKAILSQAAQGDFPVVVIGDSIVELAAIPNLCGQPTLNAGLAGMPVENIDELAKALFADHKAKLVVIAAGVNNAHDDDPEDPATFEPAYRDIISRARASGAKVVSMNIAPVAEQSFGAAGLFDPARIQKLNTKIAKLGVPVIDLWSAMAVPGGSVMKPGFTLDGVHPSPLGYKTWDATLLRACETA